MEPQSFISSCPQISIHIHNHDAECIAGVGEKGCTVFECKDRCDVIGGKSATFGIYQDPVGVFQIRGAEFPSTKPQLSGRIRFDEIDIVDIRNPIPLFGSPPAAIYIIVYAGAVVDTPGNAFIVELDIPQFPLKVDAML